MYVKDGGDWRILDTSGDTPDQMYCRDSTSFTNNEIYSYILIKKLMCYKEINKISKYI